MLPPMRHLLLIVVLLGSCGGKREPSPEERAAAVRACHDLVDQMARKGQRCGLEYEVLSILLESTFTCASMQSIRDEQLLRTTCFRFLQTSPCGAPYDEPSCKNQLTNQAGMSFL